MSLTRRIEMGLEAALAWNAADRPPRLDAALRHAVFPGGRRLRPVLVHRVAAAGPRPHRTLASAAATAVELVHCASLVHDDLPCFDDADTRRGRPSVHRAHGQALAVLAGDGLIVLAFEVLARLAPDAASRAVRMIEALACHTGAGSGIIAGQGQESERRIDLSTYHRQKTGGLFEAALKLGALAGGHGVDAWSGLGLRLGEVYQALDDLRDVLGDPRRLGKPIGVDAACGRPNAARDLGVAAAVDRARDGVAEIVDAVPPCPGREAIRAWMRTCLAVELPVPRAPDPPPRGERDAERSPIP